MIGAGAWLAGLDGQGFTLVLPLVGTLGAPRLSRATIALTRGSFWPSNETPAAPKECPAIPTRLVDSTGAGDSFDAGFLAAFLAHEPLQRCLEIGNACGALSTLAIGGTASQPTMAEALAALGKSSLP